MADDHSHKTSSWVAIILIIVSSIVLGVAFIAQSVPLAVVGIVVGLAGAGVATAFRIMDDAF